MAYIIGGFGKFGKLAYTRLREAFPDAPLVVVEHRPEQEVALEAPDAEVVSADVVSFLATSTRISPDDYVVPMVPFHLAAAFVLAQRDRIRLAPFPEPLLAELPNSFKVAEHTATCSYADFVCPDDCPEGDVCTVTGLPRDDPLFDRIGRLTLEGYSVVVVRSEQMVPGLGGYRHRALVELSERVTFGRFLIATSCKCHGVITSLAG